MRYSKVMQRCDVANLSVSHVVFFMMSSPSSGTSQSRKGCSERNSDSDKSVWGGFWSEPWANVLLWGAVFFPSHHFISNVSRALYIFQKHSSNCSFNSVFHWPSWISIVNVLFGTLYWHLIRLGFGYCWVSHKYLTQRAVYLAVVLCFDLPEPVRVWGLIKCFHCSHITQDFDVGNWVGYVMLCVGLYTQLPEVMLLFLGLSLHMDNNKMKTKVHDVSKSITWHKIVKSTWLIWKRN